MTALDAQRGESPYRLLSYIDPYGDTVFNPNQAADLIEDLDLALGSAHDEEEKRYLVRIRVMAEHLRDGLHVYLWFIGD